MSETREFLFSEIEENRKHAHLSENRRAALANVILVVASPVHLVLPFVGFNRNALPLTLLLILIGIYGLLVTAKLYERQLFHLLRARKLRSRLDELYPEAQVLALHDLAEKEHTTRHASFFYIRLNNIWLGLYALIAGLGMVYTMICLFR